MTSPDSPAATALTAEQMMTGARALIKRWREVFPGDGWPDLETATSLLQSALTAVAPRAEATCNDYSQVRAAPSAAREGEAADELKKLAHDYADRCGWPLLKDAGFRRCHPNEIAECMMRFATDVLSIVPRPAHPPTPASDQAARVAELEAALADIIGPAARCLAGRHGHIWDRLRTSLTDVRAALGPTP